jgi:hypothetical protein
MSTITISTSPRVVVGTLARFMLGHAPVGLLSACMTGVTWLVELTREARA